MATKKDNRIARPPVVAVMGHIDHGKSTLLDYIRKSNVAEHEAGGITQHIGAYEVVHEGKGGGKNYITFLDTPGHEAFKGIRARGARVADVAILVVSAEDGVKPQTLEALASIKEAGIPYVVAVTKIDRPSADLGRVRQSLAEHEIYIEGYGGTIPSVPVSGKTGEGIDELLDMLLLVAALEELKGNPDLPAEGVIIESHRDAKKGVSATIIIKNGTLESGGCIVAGDAYSPLRMLEGWNGSKITRATFSSPVKIIGWNKVPEVGMPFTLCNSKKEAEAQVGSIADEAVRVKSAQEAAAHDEKDDSGEGVENTVSLPLVIKADATGSIEAVLCEIDKLDQSVVPIKILTAGVGSISENDVKLASGARGSFVIGFNARVDAQAKILAERDGIPVETFEIIYKLVERLAEILKERTPKILVEENVGTAKVMKIFSKTRDRYIIGGKVEQGILSVGSAVRVMRREVEVTLCTVRGLEQNRVKTSEVKAGYEFGAMVECPLPLVPADRLQAFVTHER